MSARNLMAVVQIATVAIAMQFEANAGDPVSAHWRWNQGSSGVYSYASTQNWVDGSGATVRVPSQVDDQIVFDENSATEDARFIDMSKDDAKGTTVIIPKIVDSGRVSGNMTIRSATRKTNESWERIYQLVDPTSFLGVWDARDARPRWILPALDSGSPKMTQVDISYSPTVDVRSDEAHIGKLMNYGGLQKDGSGSLVVESIENDWRSWYWNKMGLLSFGCNAHVRQFVLDGSDVRIGVEDGKVVSVGELSFKSGSKIVKEGEGRLVLDDVGASSYSVAVKGGTFSVGHPSYANAVPAGDAALWLDASDENSFQTTDQGLKWRDRRWQDGANGFAIQGTEEGVGAPERKTDEKTGLSYVDFGWGWKRLENPSGEKNLKSNAAYMNLNPAVAPSEAFVVVRMKRGQGGSSRHVQTDVLTPSFFGCTSDYYTRLGSKAFVSIYAISPVLSGLWQLDGAPCLAEESYIEDQTEFHVVNVATESNVATINMLARDQMGDSTVHIGGMEIAEQILYSRRLTVEERNQTLAYLLKKWRNTSLPSDAETAHLSEVSYADDVTPVLDVAGDVVVERLELPLDATAFVKKGAGAAVVSNMAGTVRGYQVDGGSLKAVLSAGPARASAFHVDAGDSEHIEKVDDTSERVDIWRDADSNGVYAYTTTLAGQSSIVSYPVLKVSTGDDGLIAGSKYVDFENKALMRWNLPNGGGKYWNNPPDGKEVHLVIAVEGEVCPLGNAGNNGLNPTPQAVPVFCETGNQMFRTDVNSGSYNYQPMEDAYCLVDGDEVGYDWRNNAWPDGRHDTKFHVVSIVLNGSAKFGFSNFGSGWNVSSSQYKGRMRLAEMIVYNTKTNSTAEAQAIHARLLRKWKGLDMSNSFNVAQNAAFELEPKTKTEVSVLNGGSTIDVGDLTGVSQIIASFETDGTFNSIRLAQGVSFASVVAVRIEMPNPRAIQAGEYDLLTAAGTVDMADTTFELELVRTGNVLRYANLIKTPTGLRLSVTKPGLVIVVE